MINTININKYIPHIACVLALSTLISITALVCDNKRDRLEKDKYKTQDQITQTTRPPEITKVPQTSTGEPTIGGDVGGESVYSRFEDAITLFDAIKNQTSNYRNH